MLNDKTTDLDFGFAFEAPPGWQKTALPCGEGNSLREVLDNNPSLVGLTLSSVWCLHTCNMIWASKNWGSDGPWRDADWTNNESSTNAE